MVEIILYILMLHCACRVPFSKNSIESVIYLILTFFCAAVISILCFAEFLGLLFIIIYVGAIAVLFLFVVMMIDTKKSSNNFIFEFASPILESSLFICFIFIISTQSKFENEMYLENLNFELFLDVDTMSNVFVLGQAFYNNYSILFLLCGFVLLVALVGSIILTLQFNRNGRNQLDSRQLSRTYKCNQVFDSI